MNVLISGSRGLIGSALVPYLTARGRTVTRLVRGPAQPGGTEIPWGPTQGKLDPLMLEGHDAVVHLAGRRCQARCAISAKRQVRQSSRCRRQLPRRQSI